MRLLTVTLFSLLLYREHQVAGSAPYAYYMEMSSPAAPDVDDTDTTKHPHACRPNDQLEIDDGKGGKQQYDIKCPLPNSFVLKPASINGGPLGSLDGCGYCHFDGTNGKICQQGTVSDSFKAGDAFFTDSPMCKLDGSKAGAGTKLALRFPRQQDLQKHSDGDSFHIKTMTNFIDHKVDEEIPLTKAANFYGNAFDWQMDKTHSCTGCMEIGHLLFDRQENAGMDITIYPKDTCQWIFICLDFIHVGSKSSCNRKAEINLLLHHGIVTSGVRKTAMPMNMRAGRSIRILRSAATEFAFHVSSGQNERLVIAGMNTKKMAMAMSHHDCLEAPIAGLGTMGNTHFVITPAPGLATPTGPPADDDTYTTHGNSSMPIAPPVAVPGDPSTTESYIGFTQVSTTEVTLPAPNAASMTMGLFDPGQDGTAPALIGWLTWAYFYGSLAGTLLGFLVCALMFFFCRRSIYGNWYRGMYKRYGCDASGTTGGVTGAEFGATTTGGNTTIGATTAGATTTSGASTMGDTSTSGGTTSAGGNTETKSMITM